MTPASSGSWFTDAACLGADPEPFFHYGTEEALIVCRSRPSVTAGLEYALANRLTVGVWPVWTGRLREAGQNPLGDSEQSVDELGWKGHKTAEVYAKAHDRKDPSYSWADAFTLASLGEDRAAPVRAVSESERITLGTAERFRRSETKAIAAEIANLPKAEKAQVARELIPVTSAASAGIGTPGLTSVPTIGSTLPC